MLMKSYKLILFLILSSLYISCSNDDEGDNAQIECVKDVSFNEDRNPVTLPIGTLESPSKAELLLKDPSPFNPLGVSRSFGLRLQSGLTIFDITLEIIVENSSSCIPIGIYNTQTLDSNEGIMSFLYVKELNTYTVGLGEGIGELEITKCDLDNKLISGKFSCTMKEAFGSDVLQITNGIFEDVCFTE